LLGLLVAAAAVGDPPAARPVPVRAEPPLPSGLAYVPHDAALFVYADAAAIWASDLTKAFRAVDPNWIADLEKAAEALGAKPADLKSAVLFVPKVKGVADTGRFGVVLTFAKAYDAKKLAAGFADGLPKGLKLKLVTPSEAVAVVLVGLGEEYGKPQPAAAEGHLTGAIEAAAGGTHTVVVGATLANLPDELQKDDLPAQVRAFRPLVQSQAVVATLDVGKALALRVRVKTRRAAQAADAEKALAALVKLVADEGGRELPGLEKTAAGEPGLKDAVTVLKAALAAAKGAKFEVDGTEARASLTLPLDGLPVAAALTAGVAQVRQAAAAQQSANNLKQIALAMHNYHDATGAFPPAAVCDKKGKPQLSWRVLLLPYLEQNELYKQFKLDEPWDSAHNKPLLAKMPPAYAMPLKTKPGGTDTYYRAFVGNGAGWDWVVGGKITQITDGTSNTLMAVAAAGAVPWTKPDELAFDPEKDMAKLIGRFNGRFQMALFDGSVRSMAKLPGKDTLNALITKSGGEVLGADFSD
jgi:hypothetical protein